MKKTSLVLFPLLAGALAVGAPAARADIAWQHIGQVTADGQKIASFDFRNYWSGDNHRAQLSFDVTKVMNAVGAPPVVSGNQTLIAIERLGDDRLIAALPSLKMHIDEPYKSLKSRLRFNIWDGLDLKLAKTPTPPSLTPEQRQRLGQEVRAILKPIYSQVTKTYFRALPTTRVIDGMTCRGYRYTSKSNVGSPGQPQWVSSAAEWWLANQAPGDQTIADFTAKAMGLHDEAGPNTVSMWINEISPIMWEAAPEEMHQALASFIGMPGAPDYGFRGTPMQFFVTLTPPPAAQMMGGDIRVAIKLKTRSVMPITADKFEPPAGSTRQPIEPLLVMARNGIKQGQTQAKKMLKDIMSGKMPMWSPQG